MFLPLVAPHEAKEQVEHVLLFHVEEVAAADVERLAVHLGAPAEPARLIFLVQHHKRFFPQQAEGVREGEAGRTGTQDDVFVLLHREGSFGSGRTKSARP